MTNFVVNGDPEALRTALLEAHWGISVVNGQALFNICPMCQAVVPTAFSDTKETTPRVVHIRYHVSVAEALAKVTEYERNQGAIESSLRLGIAAESDDPALEEIVTTLTDKQVRWIAAWLAGEGFSR